MMVPRAFLFSSAPPQKPFQSHGMNPSTPPDYSSLLSTPNTESRRSINTIPVVIPPKRGSRTLPPRREIRSRALSKTSESSHRSSSSSSSDRPIPTSFTLMLDATAIPVPRRNWTARRPRKLPRGNHVEDFSRMLQEDIESKEESFLDGAAYSPLDILLSPPDKLLPCHDSEHESPPSVRSTSSDSIPSLDHGLASPSSLLSPPTPSNHRSPPERRQPRYSNCEECDLDHPLLRNEIDIDELEYIEIKNDNGPATPDAVPARRSASFGRLGSSFKSNLTASLRAIKSAAQSVSTFATPSVQTEDFLTRSLFTITPEMTDDRRPLPMQETPSPALRRYLNPSPMNPTPMSPAEMYVYHDHPLDKLQTSKTCPVSIQMQTYRRAGGRGNRRSHFHIASKDQKFVAFDPENPPMSRQREIRENSDFLRVVVLEMNMRRSGKLRDDIPARARIWLPARKTNSHLSGQYEDGDDNNAVPTRWVGVSAH
ncbi:hypothetical protein DTO013E5_643 [Penicillium roqueforti]|uniref:Genomic scaffold, ProqFM164S02 n=1 Tax=Penicillium roqueforti (strain FM164) TaxID=1365484 RepID=W6Q426_PENRF|nr:uncharacterized protein LCP9604111_347 [Penicillium roqueforti]CDM30711.1 unnamed protein product [Penicillium roqueforti FM164]KAF9252821.1 hypothetical protein LCP9604111_347 [Penicillium roqueforti]KAI1838484.1 hypothetical protein CBS147337_209 [Penicillium roqueforti]KAI2680598.1 hypothetical protein CBS147355_3578 [Penicillium roqueforti]KAI2691013.1 hypothetical protein LCP963914a_1214 [Penicillium roqueforti]